MNFEMLVVADDVAATRSRTGKVGRRGIAGTVLVHKATGTMAAVGSELEDIVRVDQLVSQSVVSISVSLGWVYLPGRPIEDKWESQWTNH